MEPIDPLVTAYAERYSSQEPAELAKISQRTVALHPKAHMLSGHLQGRLLAMISNIVKPAYVLEVGSFTGYSAICLAEGLTANGELHTIEIRPEEAATARKNFNDSEKASQLILHEGDAAAIIPELKCTWDLVFLDADKTGYLSYYEMILPRMRKGGLMLVDNVFFHGEVFEQKPKGKNAKALQAFNEFILADNRVEKVMLTLRDGLYMIQKK